MQSSYRLKPNFFHKEILNIEFVYTLNITIKPFILTQLVNLSNLDV